MTLVVSGKHGIAPSQRGKRVLPRLITRPAMSDAAADKNGICPDSPRPFFLPALLSCSPGNARILTILCGNQRRNFNGGKKDGKLEAVRRQAFSLHALGSLTFSTIRARGNVHHATVAYAQPG